MTKNDYINLVSDAYANPDGRSHRLIKKKFQRWIGKSKAPFWLRTGNTFRHYVLKTARALAQDAIDSDLGYQNIGFEQLKIRCYKTDANSASVYLFGMSDNYPIYLTYQTYLGPSSTAVDIGANIGMHSLVMASLCGEQGKVYAFEPSRTIYKRLLENLEVNQLHNVIPFNEALGNQTGEIGFADDSQRTNIGTSHIDRSLDTKVPINKLDDKLPETVAIDLMKIDVEGFELDVLKGSGRILLKHNPVIVLEFNPEDYSLTELIATIPYPVHIYGISSALYRKSRQIVTRSSILHDLKKECNILILPADANLPGPDQ